MKKSIATILLVTLIFSISACGNNSASSTNQQVQTEQAEETQTENSIDLSAFEGICPVSVNANIEKEDDSWLLDVNIKATNNSDKHISQLVLYFVKCYNDDTPLESRQYCDKLLFENLAPNETKDMRWILGTTTQGAREYILYVAYILYDDGSSWGEETIKHDSVVTIGVKADIFLYGSGVATVTTNKKYIVSYNARVISNSSVGDSWTFGMKYNDTTFRSGDELLIGVGNARGPILTIFACESDAENDDYAQKDIHFGDLSVGQSETIVVQLMVTENEGRYIGQKAYIEFTVTVTCTGE